MGIFDFVKEAGAKLTGRGKEQDPTQTITQILYIKEFWKARPGTTYAEATQINAHVQYAIISLPTGVRYDGGAFVTYKIKRKTGLLTGRIESGDLLPRYRLGGASEPFASAKFSGTFRATEDPTQVVNILQQLESLFSQRVEHSGG